MIKPKPDAVICNENQEAVVPTYHGVVKGNVVVLPEDVQLPEGQVVEVRVPSPEGDQSEQPASNHTGRISSEDPEELFKQRLLELGLIREIKRPAPIPPVDGDPPILVKSRRLSEQIIEDRR